jgi:hypothetical protein
MMQKKIKIPVKEKKQSTTAHHQVNANQKYQQKITIGKKLQNHQN